MGSLFSLFCDGSRFNNSIIIFEIFLINMNFIFIKIVEFKKNENQISDKFPKIQKANQGTQYI